jgi:hypothetical protein
MAPQTPPKAFIPALGMAWRGMWGLTIAIAAAKAAAASAACSADDDSADPEAA